MAWRVWPWGLGVMVCLYNLPQLLAGSVQFDGVDVHYAAQRYLSDELHAGRVPFWTPFIFSGFPFLADLQVGAWYPLNWPFLLAGITPRSLGLELWLHDLIAGAGAYALARKLLGSSAAAALAAMFYALSGWFAAHSQHVGMVDTAAWLPWLLLLLLGLAEAVTPRRLVLAALLGAAIVLPGHFQLALYTFSFVAVWAASEALARRCWMSARRFAIGLATAGMWGALLAAVMIVPALELVSQSVRTQLDALALSDIGYFHLSSLLTLVDPDYYGLLSGRYIGPGDSTQHYFYAGLVLVPLVVLGLPNRLVLRTSLFLGVPFLAYALGPGWGVFRLVSRLPGFRSVELPMHGWFLPALGLALLGGAGAAVIERRVGPRGMALLASVLLLDVLTVNQLLNPLAYARASFDERYGAPLRTLAAQVAAAPSPVVRVYGPPLAAVGYRNHALQSRVETTYGYNPLELRSYAEYAAAAEANPRLIGGFAATHELGDDAHLDPRANVLPLASFVSTVISVADDAAARTALQTLDPAAATIIVGPAPPIQTDPTATVSVVTRSEAGLTLRYTSATPNLLRVAIPFYPGWRASLNGTAVPLLTVDHAFIGVLVPPGQGDLTLAYTPRLFWLGAASSGLALLAALAVSVSSSTSGSLSK